MESNPPESDVNEARSNLREAAADAMDEARAKVGQNAQDFAAKARKLCADFNDVLRESTAERPLTSLAIAAGVGFVLGVLRAANRPRRNG